MLGYLELFFGKSFTGKTARMLHEVRAEERLVIVDPKCAQLSALKGFQHVWPNYNEKPSGWLEGDGHPAKYFESRLRDRIRVVIHLRTHFKEQLELLCLLIRSVGNLTLAVDELGLFIPSGSPASLPPSITSAMISGRHEGLKFCGTAQRPALVHATARCNAERIRWFRMTDDLDVDAARRHVGEFGDEISTLPNYVCIETTDGGMPFRDESMVGKIAILGSASPRRKGA
jgi:DNA helicase HerA-like ATPase